ncbi:unnamed protein product [Phaeothamnion confervicola]
MRSSRHRERAKAPRHDACACSFLLHSWSLLLAVLLLCCGEIVAEVRSVSKVYHSVCLQKGQQYWDYDSYALTSMATESVDSFEITRRLDSGKFSQVMEAIDIRDNRLVVLKILKPVQPKKVKREICILQTLAGGPNIVALEGVCRDEETDTTCLVLEHLGPGARWLAHGGPRHSAAATFAAAAAAAPPTAPEPLLSSAAEAMSGAGAAADQATSPSAVEMKLSDTDVKCFMYRLLEVSIFSESTMWIILRAAPSSLFSLKRRRCWSSNGLLAVADGRQGAGSLSKASPMRWNIPRLIVLAKPPGGPTKAGPGL